MSEHMEKFLRDFYKWLLRNEPLEPSELGVDYFTTCGICNNLYYYCDRYVRDASSLDYDKELKSMFISAGLDEYYPFNPRHWHDYYNELVNNTIYDNPKRMAWLEGVLSK